MKAKICGLSEISHVKTCVDYGAAFCGFILNWPKSHRNITFDKVKKLTTIEKKNSNFVGVLVNPTNEEIEKFKFLNLQYLQLHGEEKIERVREIKNYSKKKIIKTIKIKEKNDIEIYKKYTNLVDIFLFDSKGYEKSQKFDHSLLNHLDKKNNKWMIAGNIGIEDLENVSKIADYVDVSGSLETNKEKDIQKIKKFLKEVKKIGDEN